MVRKQLAYMLGRQYVGLELNDEPKDKADLTNIMSNSHINEHFNSLAREVSLLSYDDNNLFSLMFSFVYCSYEYFSWIYWNLRLQMMFIRLGWKA